MSTQPKDGLWSDGQMDRWSDGLMLVIKIEPAAKNLRSGKNTVRRQSHKSRTQGKWPKWGKRRHE